MSFGRKKVLVLHQDEQVHLQASAQGWLSVFDPSEFNSVVEGMRRPFVNMLDALARTNGKMIDWWVSPLGAKNTCVSSSFLQTCYLFYALEVVKKHTLTMIICNGEDLRNVLISTGCVKCPIEVRGNEKNRLIGLAEPLFRSMKVFFTSANRWASAKLTRRSACKFSSATWIADVFVDRESLKSGSFKNRYYQDFIELSLLNWVYLPTFYNIRTFYAVFKTLRKNQVPFLLKEDFLRINDYLWAFFHWFRLRLINVEEANIHGFNISEILRHDLNSHAFNGASFEGLLNYRFAKRLAESEFNPELLLDWFEGQEIDKGLQRGFSEFLQDCVRVGYQGFLVTKNYLCFQPTSLEIEQGVAPEHIASIGRIPAKALREFAPRLDAFAAPAFRFQQGVVSSTTCSDKIVLIALPILQSESENLVAIALAILSNCVDVTVVIKPHPAALDTPSLRIVQQTERLHVLNVPFAELIAKTKVIVSSTSSILVEAVMMGVPAVVLGSPAALTQNPIPADVPGDLWRLCFSREDAIDQVERFLSRKRLPIDLITELKNEFFEPSTEESIERFECELGRLRSEFALNCSK